MTQNLMTFQIDYYWDNDHEMGLGDAITFIVSLYNAITFIVSLYIYDYIGKSLKNMQLLRRVSKTATVISLGLLYTNLPRDLLTSLL